jgi:hypothetical protein
VTQLEFAGTANVHHVAYPGEVLPVPDSPVIDCPPCLAVSIPSEKLDPSGPGSLIAEPDCPSLRELSQAEIVNEWPVLSVAALLIAS